MTRDARIVASLLVRAGAPVLTARSIARSLDRGVPAGGENRLAEMFAVLEEAARATVRADKARKFRVWAVGAEEPVDVFACSPVEAVRAVRTRRVQP